MKAKVVFHLDWNEEKPLIMALKNITNLLKQIQADESAICLVANGTSVQLFQSDRSPEHTALIEDLCGRGVHFLLCNNSLNDLDIGREKLIQNCEIVPAGVVELIKLQTEGYAYIKP